MNNIRKFLYVLTGVALVAFALPAAAADKLFDISVAQTGQDPPGVLQAGKTTTLSVTFTNKSPDGNSVGKSVRLTAPTGVTFTSASVPAGAGTVSPTPATTITVNNMPGLKFNGTLTITLSASVSSTAFCSVSTFKGEMFTGNSLSGTAFQDFTAFQGGTVQLYSTEAAYVGCDGPLSCGEVFDQSNGATLGVPGYAHGVRGANLSNGSCADVMFGLTNNILTSCTSDPVNCKQVILEYNTLTADQPDAFFDYTLVWAPTSKAPSTKYSVTQSKWQVGNVLGGFAPTLFCLSATPPVVYATVGPTVPSGTGVPAGATTIPVTVAVSPPSGNSFSIRIDAEVMLVIKTSGNGAAQIWTVSQPTQSGHGEGTSVSSNPFPNVPADVLFQNAGYAAGSLAHVCAASESSAQVGGMWQYATRMFSTGDPFHVGP